MMPQMVTSNRYRTKAQELRREAQREDADPVVRIECERLAASYENLAEQLEKIAAQEPDGRREN
jgi:hypothetical protein